MTESQSRYESRGKRYVRNGLSDGNLFCELIVEMDSIPVAGFLSHIDCEMFIRACPEYYLERIRVYCNIPERDCYGESISGKRFLEERGLFKPEGLE